MINPSSTTAPASSTFSRGGGDTANLKYKRKMMMMMNNQPSTGTIKVGNSRSRSSVGIKLNLRKISIRRLRARFCRFLRFLNNHIWRRFQLILKSSSAASSSTTSSSSSSSWDSSSGYVSARPSFSSSSRSLGSAFNTIISGGKATSYYNGCRSARVVVSSTEQCRRLKSLTRNNSFYAEAIADCIEFIKRSSTTTTGTSTFSQHVDNTTHMHPS